jgi:predicted nucleic acid-binding protein
MTDYLVDSNILLRRIQTSSPQRPIVKHALRTLAGRGDRLCITPQNLHEFWYVATRPVARNGLGLTPAQTARKLGVLKRAFVLLPDTPDIYAEWEGLVTALSIADALSYDARLVAVMRVHGLTHILTFNAADFRHFPGITVVDPATV